LILVGDGEERDRLASKAGELGIADHVHFAGRIDDPAEYLRAADAFVLPSVAEGMSNSLLEAMATALPCLASRIGGNTDLIDHGHDGMLIPPGDRSAWGSALAQVVEDCGLARRLGDSARAKIEERFALPVVVDRYVDLYRRLLAENSGARPS
jgi:glycosyltransferase involved in cell wall biosynthesis